MSTTPSGPEACRRLLAAFFAKHPNDQLRGQSEDVLKALEKKDHPLPGKPGGWAAGIVYAVGCTICGVPGVLNAELEKAFGVSMSTVRRRAAGVRREIPSAWPTPDLTGY